MKADFMLAAGRWQVVFTRQQDRLAHEIRWLKSPEESSMLLASREGIPDEEWPPSPPLQELHIEQRSGDLTVALLVGMAGDSHWSLVVEAHERDERLVFEAACRVRAEPRSLGSCYEVGTQDAIAVQACGQALRMAAATNAWRIEHEPLDGTPSAALNYDLYRGRVVVSPGQQDVNCPQTFRWRYSIAPIT